MQRRVPYFGHVHDAGSDNTLRAFGDRQWRARHSAASFRNERNRSRSVNDSAGSGGTTKKREESPAFETEVPQCGRLSGSREAGTSCVDFWRSAASYCWRKPGSSSLRADLNCVAAQPIMAPLTVSSVSLVLSC